MSENGTAFAFKAKPGHRIQYTTAPATSSSSSSSSSSFSSTNSVLIGHYTYVDENTEMMEGGLGECQESGLRKEPGESGEGVVLTIGKDSECFYLSDLETCLIECTLLSERGVILSKQRWRIFLR